MRNKIHNLAEDISSKLIEKLQASDQCTPEVLMIAARVFKKASRNCSYWAKGLEMAKNAEEKVEGAG